VLALMLQPGHPAASEQPAQPAASKPSAPMPGSASPPPARIAPVKQAAPSRHLARAAVLAGIGTLPGLNVGGGLHLGIAGTWAAAEARFALWLPKTAWSSSLSQAGAELWLIAVSPVACLRLTDPAFRLDTCGGTEFAQMTGRGFGMSDPSRATARWASVYLEQAAIAHLTEHTGLRAALGLLYPLSRPAFAIENVGELHRPDQFSLSAALAFELKF